MSNLVFPYAPGFGGPLAPVLSFVDQGNGTYALPVAVLSGGGGGGAGYSITDLILQDSTGAQGIRREKIDPAGTVTFVYENFDGTAWTPTAPMVAVAIAPGAGVATAAKQDTGNTSVASIDTKMPTVGQKTKSGSVPVVVASDQGALSVSVAAATTVSSTAYEASHILKASAGTLYEVTFYNSSASAQFYLLHDSATLPADTAVPVRIVKVPSGGTGSFDFGLRGRPFSTGIVITNSSTGPTKTIGSADSFYDALIA